MSLYVAPTRGLLHVFRLYRQCSVSHRGWLFGVQAWSAICTLDAVFCIALYIDRANHTGAKPLRDKPTAGKGPLRDNRANADKSSYWGKLPIGKKLLLGEVSRGKIHRVEAEGPKPHEQG